MDEARQPPVPLDYDTNPERYRSSARAVEEYGLRGDVHELVAERLSAEGCSPVLDVGCGEGRLTRILATRGVPFVGLDSSPTMLAGAPRPCVKGDAARLPFRSGHFGGVVALYMLYHLADPREALAEGHRVLRAGGLFAAATPSRYDDPELAAVLPQTPSTFDAEDAADIVGGFFQDLELESWDAPLIHLPDIEALTAYLMGRGLDPPDARSAVEQLATPLTLTKRGALIYGYKR